MFRAWFRRQCLDDSGDWRVLLAACAVAAGVLMIAQGFAPSVIARLIATFS